MYLKNKDIQGASKEEKVNVFNVADKLIADNGLPRGTKVKPKSSDKKPDHSTYQITRIVEGIETAIFKQYFASWNETGDVNFGFGR